MTGRLDAAAYPHVLREYALLADGERGAVIGPRGDIGWLCAPRWHDGSVFSTLVGGSGVYSIAPSGRFVWGGYYEPGTLVWHSRWVTEHGVVESREALAYPGDEHRLVLLRQVRALDAPARLDVLLRPRADYDRQPLSEVGQADGVWRARCGRLRLRWSAGTGVRHRDDALWLGFALVPGEHRDLVLEISDTTLADPPPAPDDAWHVTETSWHGVVPDTSGALAARDVAHSLAVLHGMTSRSGAMVAAATTSLPERSDTARSYDYRYAWVRDQCYAGQAAAAVGDTTLLDASVGFVTERLRADGEDLRPAYRVTGDRLPGETHLSLPGYPGGTDVIGNRAGTQFQLDALGEALLLIAEADRLGRADARLWSAAEAGAAAIAARWRQPDAGVWELEPRAWTHSRLTASAGLRALAGRHGSGGRAVEWLALADDILADTTRAALAPAGHWQRAADDAGLDGSLLLPPLRGAVPPGDPRTAATLLAYLRELTVDGYAFRFRHDQRPLSDAEGSFLLCGFLVAMALHDAGDEAGDPVEARAWFERTRAATGPPALFSEEYDPHQHQLRGNIPQAFVHAVMVEAAVRLRPAGRT